MWTLKKTEEKYIDTLYVLDWLINKPVKVTGKIPIWIHPQDRIVYKWDKNKDMVGIVLWYPVKVDKTWSFAYALKGTEEENFNYYQRNAKELFKTFKERFTAVFPLAKPITARMDLSGRQIYFYFFAEQRFDFSNFVKEFRQEINYHFFLYQVGARDRVRLHPHLEERYDPSGLPLMYHIFKHPLEGVEGETVDLQWLYGNNDKLKDRSGKLDHTLNFEKDIYAEENKKYPQKGRIVTIDDKPMKCAGFNILTQEIKFRGKIDDADENTNPRFLWKGEFKIITLAEYQAIKNKPKTSKSTTESSWKITHNTTRKKTPTRREKTSSWPNKIQQTSHQKNSPKKRVKQKPSNKKIIGHNKKIIGASKNRRK